MESLAEPNTITIENFTPEDKKHAEEVKKELNLLLDELQTCGKKLDKGFVKLGILVEEVSEKKLWLLYGDFKSFNAWLETVEKKVDKGRTRLYSAKTIAKQLLPYLPPEEIEQVGITKASKLAQAVKESGKRPSDLLIEAAKDAKITTEQFESLIADNYGARAELETGAYFSLGAIFLSDEELDEWQRAVAVVCKTEPPFQYVVTKWQDASANQKKEILWRLMANYLSEYESEVNGQ